MLYYIISKTYGPTCLCKNMFGLVSCFSSMKWPKSVLVLFLLPFGRMRPWVLVAAFAEGCWLDLEQYNTAAEKNINYIGATLNIYLNRPFLLFLYQKAIFFLFYFVTWLLWQSLFSQHSGSSQSRKPSEKAMYTLLFCVLCRAQGLNWNIPESKFNIHNIVLPLLFIISKGLKGKS